MIIIRNRNVKNLYLVIGFVVSMLLILIGTLLKINKIESGNTFLIFGLIVKVQVILMVIYKYGYLMRKSLTKWIISKPRRLLACQRPFLIELTATSSYD